MTITLRPYQFDAAAAARAAYARGLRSVLLVGPTGMGKSAMIAWIAERHVSADAANSVLVVVHRTVLVDDLSERIRRAGAHERVQVVSVQGLLAARKRQLPLPPATLLVFDEAHHYAADEWSAVAAAYPDALIVGFTATPVRSDKRPLTQFQELIVVAQTHELQAEGHLVPCVVIAPARKRQALAESPVAAYQQHTPGKRAIVFCADQEHARTVADEFSAAGIAAASMDADTPERERTRILAEFRAGALRVLTNVFLLTEGFDDPGAEVCVIARGCDHVGAFLQMVGRVLRPCDGKTEAVLLDLKGAVHEFGLPSDPREFSLSGEAIRSLSKLEPARQCKACGLFARSWPAECPRCGEPSPKPPRPRVSREQLQAIRSVDGTDKRRATYQRFAAQARAKGYAPGWAAHRFKSVYGFWPTREVMHGA